MRVFHNITCMFDDDKNCDNPEDSHDTILTNTKIARETYNAPVDVNIGSKRVMFKNILCADCCGTSKYICSVVLFGMDVMLLTGSTIPSFSTLLNFDQVFGSPGNSVAIWQGASVDDHVDESTDTMESP